MAWTKHSGVRVTLLTQGKRTLIFPGFHFVPSGLHNLSLFLKEEDISSQSLMVRQMQPNTSVSLFHNHGSTSLWVDKLGAGLSLACALHCLATPLLLSLLPFAGLGLLANESVETLLLGISLTLAIGSLCWGFWIHKQLRTFLFLGAAILLIVIGRFFADETLEVVYVVLGAGLLATGHLLNRHLCKTCLQCQAPDPYSAA